MLSEDARPPSLDLRRFFLGWIVAVVLAIAILIIGYFFVAVQVDHQPGSNAGTSLSLALIANLIPIALIFVASFFFLRHLRETQSAVERRELEENVVRRIALLVGESEESSESNSRVILEIERLVATSREESSQVTTTFYERFEDIEWDELLAAATSVDIIVHYFDTWVSRHEEALQRFFRNAGTLRVVLPNYHNLALMAAITKRFPEYEVGSVENKIKNCPQRFASMRSATQSGRGRIEAYFCDQTLWYPALRFDRSDLVLGMYEHVRELRVESPAVRVALPAFPKLDAWFERDFEGLVSSAADSVVL